MACDTATHRAGQIISFECFDKNEPIDWRRTKSTKSMCTAITFQLSFCHHFIISFDAAHNIQQLANATVQYFAASLCCYIYFTLPVLVFWLVLLFFLPFIVNSILTEVLCTVLLAMPTRFWSKLQKSTRLSIYSVPFVSFLVCDEAIVLKFHFSERRAKCTPRPRRRWKDNLPKSIGFFSRANTCVLYVQYRKCIHNMHNVLLCYIRKI